MITSFTTLLKQTVSMFWAVCQRQNILIYCISYINFGKNLLVDITKGFLEPPQHTKLLSAA